MNRQIWHNPGWHIVVLGLLTLLTRLPFRSSVLFNWDSVNFAFGILDFDVIKHRPHPPGYILYIMSGKMLTLLTNDPNASLVWLSIVSGVLAVVLTYALGLHFFGVRDAFIGALLLMTSPLVWFYNEIALTYSLELFFSVAIAYTCYRTLTGSIWWAYIGALLLGLAGGFRQTTLLFMLPLALYAALRLSWRHRLGTGALVTVICLGWGLPLLANTGGLSAYLRTSFQLSSISEPGPFSDVLRSLFFGGHLAVLLVLGFWFGFYTIKAGSRPPWERWFIVLWVVPGLLVVVFRHIGQSGYLLFFLPPIFIYTPSLLRGALERLETIRPTAGARRETIIEQKMRLTVLVFILVGTVAFLLGANRLIQWQNYHWQSMQTLPEQYPPSQTIVLTNLSLDSGFRHASYYLPDYHVYALPTKQLDGPAVVADPTLVPGWVFHSYQYEDNYDLNRADHHLNTILDLPPGTTGLLVTDKHLVPLPGNSTEKDIPDKFDSTDRHDWLIHVTLPTGARQLIITGNRLEVR
ncbi:ArnT family glycosyltransferase [Chloroflexota bacterium]